MSVVIGAVYIFDKIMFPNFYHRLSANTWINAKCGMGCFFSVVVDYCRSTTATEFSVRFNVVLFQFSSRLHYAWPILKIHNNQTLLSISIMLVTSTVVTSIYHMKSHGLTTRHLTTQLPKQKMGVLHFVILSLCVLGFSVYHCLFFYSRTFKKQSSFFIKVSTVLQSIKLAGMLFHISITLLEKKYFLTSRLTCGLLCPRPHRAEALSDDARLTSDVCVTSVCLSRTSGLSRDERPRKTKIGIEVAHVTRDSDTTFKGAYCGGLPHSLYNLKSWPLSSVRDRLKKYYSLCHQNLWKFWAFQLDPHAIF